MFKKFMLSIILGLLLMVPVGTVQSATYSDFTSGDNMLTRSALAPIHNYLPFIHYRTFDFSSGSLNDGSGVTNGDVVRLFNVDKDTIIEEFGIRITTASLQGQSATGQSGTSAEVGDGSDIDGFVGNNIEANRIPFIDLSNIRSSVSKWNLNPFPIMDGVIDGGATTFTLSGVSISGVSSDPYMITLDSNCGPFFSSGASPYLSPDTIDMTVYVDKAFSPGATWSGVTPIFEAYIKGFKRVSD